MSKRKRRSRKHKGKNRKNNSKNKNEYGPNDAQNQDIDSEEEIQSDNNNAKKSQGRDRVLLEEFKQRRRRQDIAFVIFLIIIGTVLFSGYYLYYYAWGADENNGANDIFGNQNEKDGSDQDFNGNDKIEWYDYDTGLRLANENNKPVLIDFYTDWCYYCEVMDENTYSDQQVIEKSKDFVCVNVDGDVRQELVASYGITGYPTTVFLDPGGTEVKRVNGYVPPGPFLEDMNYVLNNS